MSEFKHTPIMVRQVIEGLRLKSGGTYVDGTIGGAGHSLHICDVIGEGVLVGIDRDAEAISAAKQRLLGSNTKLILVNDNFKNIAKILEDAKIDKIDGALLDLGVSSHQLDMPERGFSYRFDAPLDMRMNSKGTLTAHTIVNTYKLEEIVKILFDYGEERNARKIAKRIIDRRPINTTFELVDAIKSATSPSERFADKHPAKRTFQALRIAVNKELDGLGEALGDFASFLNEGGTLAVITFHSLEDRIVKQAFNSLARGCTCPKELPICVCGGAEGYRVVTKKPITPSEEEMAQNPRSASSKLRILEKI